MKSIFLSSSAMVLALAVSGCATPIPQQLTAANVPSTYSAPINKTAPVWPQADWWKGFGSDELNSMIDAAQADNLDLAAAAARVMQAEGNAEAAGSALWPQLDLSSNAARAKSGASSALTGHTITGNTFNLGLNASYQLDLFGQFHDRATAADEALKASHFAQQTVALTTITSTGQTYLEVLALRQRVTIAEANIDAAKRILTITQAKVTNGIASRLDLAQQEAQVDSQEAQIPALKEQEAEARYALAILLGRLPEGFNVTAQNLDKIAAPAVQPGLPSELLRRRPDVAQAEANLASAHANVDAARAAFFPSIGLSATGGFASTAIGAVLKGSNFAWNIGANLAQTIFDGGNIEGQYHLSKGQQLELIADYRKAVLTAFQEVETALGQVASLAEQEKLKTDEANAAAEAFRISEIQYREGVTDLLTVLTAQETLFTAQDQLIQIKMARIQADIALYTALGGGWTEADEDATQVIPAETTLVTPSKEVPLDLSKPSTIPTTPGPSTIPNDAIVTPTPSRGTRQR